MNRIEVIQGDITKLDIEAIVNAANSSLTGGGGVDGAIHRAAGSKLLEDCRTLGGCPTGEAVLTHGYDLKAKWVIHTVGPIWSGGDKNEPELLANCYKNSLSLALKNNIKAVAFPSISTGIYSFPVDKAAGIAMREIVNFLKSNRNFDKIIMCTFSDNNFKIYKKALSNFYYRGNTS